MKEILASNLYVDNLLGTTTDEGLLKTIYSEAKKELQLANMPLRQWTSNNIMLKALIEEDFPDYQVPKLASILGLEWDTEKDTLALKPVKYSQTELKHMTKRLLLAQVSKLFSPLTIRGKLLLQESWKLKLGWDDPLPDSFREEWKKVKDEYEQINKYTITRVTATEADSCVLHIFYDASTKAYGAAAYKRTSKARVAPLQGRTITQLELTALSVGTKLGAYIHDTIQHIKIKETYLWSDNEAALQWIRNYNSKVPYVENRVAEIREIQINFHFMHVQKGLNPADLLSRGTSLKKLVKETLWLHGPEWLTDKQNWPEQKAQVMSGYSLTEVVQRNCDAQSIRLIKAERFTSLEKLFRVTSKVFKCINNIFTSKGWTRRLQYTNPTTYWIKEIQRESYHKEITALL